MNPELYKEKLLLRIFCKLLNIFKVCSRYKRYLEYDKGRDAPVYIDKK